MSHTGQEHSRLMLGHPTDTSPLHDTCRTHPGDGPVVYYLRNLIIPAGGPVKIGTTGDLPQRMTALQRTTGQAFALLASEPGSYQLERQRHVQFAADRIGGSEWFWQSFALLDHLQLLGQLTSVDDCTHTCPPECASTR